MQTPEGAIKAQATMKRKLEADHELEAATQSIKQETVDSIRAKMPEGMSLDSNALFSSPDYVWGYKDARNQTIEAVNQILMETEK